MQCLLHANTNRLPQALLRACMRACVSTLTLCGNSERSCDNAMKGLMRAPGKAGRWVILTDGQPGWNSKPKGLFMNTPQLLPEIEKGRVVVNEGTDLVEDHEEDGDVHSPCVWQGSIHIACSSSSSMLQVHAF